MATGDGDAFLHRLCSMHVCYFMATHSTIDWSQHVRLKCHSRVYKYVSGPDPSKFCRVNDPTLATLYILRLTTHGTTH